MRLRDPELLQSLMTAQQCSQSVLARRAQCSRQFVHMLINGTRKSASPDVAARIEEGLSLLPGTLFVSEVSTTMQQTDEEGAA